MWNIRILLAMTLCASLATTPVLAAKASAPELSAQEKADETQVRALWENATQHGPLAVEGEQATLEAILAHAPAQYPIVETRGAYAIIRDDNVPQARVLMLLVTAARGKRDLTVVRHFNTYGYARFLLASYAVETHQPELAIHELDIGLAMQPDNPLFISEKATALEMLRRPSDALSLIEAWLPEHPFINDYRHAVILRGKGYALVELGRLDEAEAAYKESLQLQPDHEGAQSELRYIESVRRGHPNSGPVQVMTSDKAATYVGPAKPSSDPPSPH